jgi:hypothetical protein
VEDSDLPRAVCHEKETVGLVELHHFQLWVCFEVHRASQTGNVSVAGLVQHGEQVEEGIPGGAEGHGAFYFYDIARAVDGFGFDDDKMIMMKGSLQGFLAIHRELPLRTRIHWRCAGIHWILESSAGGRFPLIPSLLLLPNSSANFVTIIPYKSHSTLVFIYLLFCSSTLILFVLNTKVTLSIAFQGAMSFSPTGKIWFCTYLFHQKNLFKKKLNPV